MAGNIHNSNTISGRGMAVLAGVILIIAPWFSSLGFLSKAGIAIVGIVLVVLGVRD